VARPQRGRQRGQRWFAVQLGLFLALLAAPFLQRGKLPPWPRLLGLVLLAGGIVVAVAGYRALGRSHSPWTTPVEGGGSLVTTGIYGRVRHPVYVGWCLAALGGELDLPPGGGHRGYAAVVDGSGLMVAWRCSHSMGGR
jgi:protein-S-isoprenylcysteine O-methyltransferase Ste14